MALVKCKECGAEISKKAETCPHCGAKRKKKTTIGTGTGILIIFVFVYVIGKISGQNDTGTTYQSTASSTTATTPSEPKEKQYWFAGGISTDEMTSEKRSFAYSIDVPPTQKMEFPYSNIKASLNVGCNKDSEWAYFQFSSKPNLTKDKTQDGYNEIHTRIRWGKRIEDVFLTQVWGEKFIHFRNYKTAINNIMSASDALLVLSWYGQGDVYFEFPLKGSSAAIKKIRAQCAKF